MKLIVRLYLKGCQIEFIEHFGPGVVAIGEIEVDGGPETPLEQIMPAVKARMLDRLFDIEYQIEETAKLLDLQRFKGPTVIYVQ